MKKVGLITYYGVNYGGMLQAYALQRCVKELGYECKIISNEVVYETKSSNHIKQKMRNLRAFILSPFKYVKRRNFIHKNQSNNSLKRKYFKRFLQENIDVDYTGFKSYDELVKNPPEYDVYLCGSDQIWNPNFNYPNGFYFADFAPENKPRIAYASSLGVSTVTQEQAEKMKPYLQKIDVISTRENDGSRIVAEITGREIRTVLDPTLLLNDEQWTQIATKPLIDKPYIFCYVFGERNYIAKIKSQVKKITGLDVVCIPYVARELSSNDTKVFEAGPSEFISLIKNAELVLTDSFHATAFSINLKTPFLSLCRFSKNDKKSMNSRLTSLLGTLGLENRLIDENDKITKEMLFDIDFQKAHSILNKKREEDLLFLKDAINYERKFNNA